MWAQCVDLLSANDSVAPLFLNWRIHLIFFYILLNVVIRIINNPISSACHSLHILVFKFSPVIYLTCYLDSSISVQKCCLKHRHTIADISLIHIKKKKIINNYRVIGMQKWLSLLVQIMENWNPKFFCFQHCPSTFPDSITGFIESLGRH